MATCWRACRYSRYEQFAQCLADVLPNCVAGTKLLYQGLRDTYDFICNDGFDGQCSVCINKQLVIGLSSEIRHAVRM